MPDPTMSMMVSRFEPMPSPMMGYYLPDDGAAYEETPNPTMSMMVSCLEPMSTPTMGDFFPNYGAASQRRR
ncbi:hypothetical protein Aduo_018004 [Ancylostoma duodenale]